MAGAPRCGYRLAMAHEYLHIARRANVAQALLLAASALLPTLAASGPWKRRVETRRGTQKCVRHDSRCEVILALPLSGTRRCFERAGTALLWWTQRGGKRARAERFGRYGAAR